MTRLNSRIPGLLVVAALALAAPGARAQGIVEHTTSIGTSGAILGQDAAHEVFAYVTQQTSASGSLQNWLWFSVYEANPNMLGGMTIVSFGSGAIPATDLATDGLGHLLLDTDTTGNSAFETFACTNPAPGEQITCGPAANPGRVRVELWRTPGTTLFHQNGQWSWQYGDTRMNQTGSGEYAPASGQGFVGALQFPPPASGTIGVVREAVVVIEQGQ